MCFFWLSLWYLQSFLYFALRLMNMPTLFSHHIMFVSFNSKTMGVRSGAQSVWLSGPYDFATGFLMLLHLWFFLLHFSSFLHHCLSFVLLWPLYCMTFFYLRLSITYTVWCLQTLLFVLWPVLAIVLYSKRLLIVHVICTYIKKKWYFLVHII